VSYSIKIDDAQKLVGHLDFRPKKIMSVS